MKICVLGLEGAAPEIIFADEQLANLRRLMDLGVYGGLQSVIPPASIPAWMCMCTSQDPGSLGLYGFRNRSDHSYDKLAYDKLAIADSAAIKAPAVWDQLAGKKSILVGVPLNCPPRQLNGISVGCFLAPDGVNVAFTYPPELKVKIKELVGEYPADVKGFRARPKNQLKEEIFNMSRKQWEVGRWLLSEQDWDYFHFVDTGLDRMHEGFWSCFDPMHPRFEPDNPYKDAIPEYYRRLDEQIGSVLELLDDQTVVLVISAYGAQRLDGAIAVNEWLIREELLVLDEYPQTPTPFEKLNVNWSKTKAWSEGGCCAQVFLNVRGREPQGVIAAAEYDQFQDEMKARLEALPGEDGQPLNSQVFKPGEIYRNLRNVAPDLIAFFGGLHWRAMDAVGQGKIHVQENDGGCNPSPHGMFVLTSPNCPLGREYEGAHLLDMAPTLLDLAGYEVPAAMQGRSLVAGMEKKSSRGGPDGESERIVHDRLAGLGYV